jgi:hypothetical protein
MVAEQKYIKCNIWRVAVCLSYIQDARFLKVNITMQKCSSASVHKTDESDRQILIKFYYRRIL